MRLTSMQINWLLGAIAEHAIDPDVVYGLQEDWQSRFPTADTELSIPSHQELITYAGKEPRYFDRYRINSIG